MARLPEFKFGRVEAWDVFAQELNRALVNIALPSGCALIVACVDCLTTKAVGKPSTGFLVVLSTFAGCRASMLSKFEPV